jgi:hypothetical protein
MAFISLRNLFDAIRGRYNGEANLVQLTGSNVEIGGVSFAVSGGDTIAWVNLLINLRQLLML